MRYKTRLSYTKIPDGRNGGRLDLREAAEALGVHYQTAYAWQQETRFIAASRPDLHVLAGRSGDSLRDLLAQAGHPTAAGQEPRA